jgi:hypothetical protein
MRLNLHQRALAALPQLATPSPLTHRTAQNSTLFYEGLGNFAWTNEGGGSLRWPYG